jgi:hypothetical protein
MATNLTVLVYPCHHSHSRRESVLHKLHHGQRGTRVHTAYSNPVVLAITTVYNRGDSQRLATAPVLQ